jgi:NitT/TauT family transport system permease protein
MKTLTDVLSPNRATSGHTMQLILFAWAVSSLVIWAVIPSVLIPGPVSVAQALTNVWSEGLLTELMVSLTTYAKAMIIASGLSLLLAYLTVVPAARPPASFVAKSRFLGLAGLSFLVTLLLGGGETLKVALMVFGMMVFMTDSMSKMVASVPREALDHARTLRMSEWRVVWEVIVLGQRDQAIEIIRQNAAMGWMMIGMVEGLVRSGGGVGAMLLSQTKHFHMAEVFAVQLCILVVGLGQDQLIGIVRQLISPYADLTVERR